LGKKGVLMPVLGTRPERYDGIIRYPVKYFQTSQQLLPNTIIRYQ